MRTRIYTEIPASGAEWRFVRSGPHGIETLPPNATLPSGADMVVFVPGTEVSAHRVRMTAKRPAEMTRLAAFAIEDELAVPVDTMHVAVAAAQEASDHRLVYAVSRQSMAGWLDALDSAGIGAARLVPDLSVLPASTHVDFGSRQLATISGRPVAIDPYWPSDVMAALMRETGAEPNIQQTDSLTQLASWAENAPRLVDFRQGEYARPSEQSINLTRFRLPAALAASLFLAWTAQSVWSIEKMKQLTAGLDAETARLYAAAFPDQPMPSNPAAALRASEGNASRSPTADFEQTSAGLYGAVAETPGASLVSLRYDRNMGELRATLTYPAFGADQDLKQAVEQTGMRVNLGDTRLEDGLVVGDLSIGARS